VSMIGDTGTIDTSVVNVARLVYTFPYLSGIRSILTYEDD